jgi:hypothetical protein
MPLLGWTFNAAASYEQQGAPIKLCCTIHEASLVKLHVASWLAQALDSLVITAEQRAAATAFSDLWALPSSAVDDCATGSAATASSQGEASAT